jgi:predicted ATP-dependent protease
MSDPREYAVSFDKLRWICDPASLPCDSSDEIPCCEGIIGQDRAVTALELGLSVRSKGYNIFVCGEPGTGRTTSVKHLLETIDPGKDLPPDVAYVNNFKDPDMPVAILLPAEQGSKLRTDMRDLVVHMRTSVQQIYESEQYKDRTKEIVERYKEREKEVIRQLEERIRAENFALIQVQLGPFSKPEIAPMISGEPVQMDRLDNLVHQGKFDKEEFQRLREKGHELTSMMEDTFREARSLKRKLRVELANLEKEFGQPVVDDYVSDLKENYDNAKVREYLDGVREQILSNMDQFKETDGEEQPTAHPVVDDERFLEYQVNVLVDNSTTDRPPVIIETSPNYRNLFGTIEKVVDRSGHWKSDFTHIKAGSLLRANGGYLVLNLYDFIMEPGVWSALKRTLKNQQVDIQGNDPLYLLSASVLKPEPIPIQVRVIVIGDAYSYRVLYALDPDFRKIFKVTGPAWRQ